MGPPPPWAEVAGDDRRPFSLPAVRRAVDAVSRRSGRAGSAQPGGAPPDLLPPAALSAPPGATGRSAVLVALFEEAGETRVILTVRSDRLRSHRGEVAFPGGRLDHGEAPVDAALREAEEEVGLSPGEVEVIGSLTSLSTYSSGTLMTPIVGTLAARPALRASPAEVARIFDVSLRDLVAEGVFHAELWPPRPGRPAPPRPGSPAPGPGGPAPPPPGVVVPVVFYDLAGETVWGATARILTELLVVVLAAG